MTNEQTIEVPLMVGSRVTIYEDVDMDEDGGFAATPVYEATVEQYVEGTGKLVMSDGTGLAELRELLDEYDSVQVMREV